MNKEKVHIPANRTAVKEVKDAPETVLDPEITVETVAAEQEAASNERKPRK